MPVLEAFEAYLLDQTLRARPRQIFVAAVRAWNWARDNNSEWPQFRAEINSQKKTYALPWTNFPPSLREEAEAMIAAAMAPDPLDADAWPAIRLTTADDRRRQIRRLASALVLMGRDPSTIRGIADLVEPVAARLILKFLLERRDGQKTGDIHRSCGLLCLLARDWVKASVETVERLEQFRRALIPGPREMTAKNRATLRPFENEQLVHRFLELPDLVFARVRRLPVMTVKAALQMQLALAVELLTAAPVRIKNLAAVRLGVNLIDMKVGCHRRVHLHFPADDVKNGVELEHVLPARTIALLDEYVEVALLLLRRGEHDFLFPGEGASHKQPGLLSTQIAGFTDRELGARLTAHQFRHLCGFIYLKSNPGGHEVLRRVFGQRAIQTTVLNDRAHP